jgi:hypothetical protein
VRGAFVLGLTAALATGCAATSSSYMPQVVARGELTLRYDGGFEMWSGGRKVASSWGWGGLPEYVRCVPQAEEHARAARRDGRFSVMMSAMGAALATAALGGGIALAGALGAGLDPKQEPSVYPLVGAALGVAVVATLFAGMARLKKNSANGHAVDAMNYYNDAVGSLGATCDDLRYPAPQPMPEAAPPPAMPEAPPPPPPLQEAQPLAPQY